MLIFNYLYTYLYSVLYIRAYHTQLQPEWSFLPRQPLSHHQHARLAVGP